jgi:alpha-ketoglutarate-dependent taurine dioxygenase
MAPSPPSPTPSDYPTLSTFAPDQTTLTPHIGTSFDSSTQLSALLAAPNSDALVRELAHLISQRGVVFFAVQDLSLEAQHELMERLGADGRRPAGSSLHRHPVSETTSELKKTTSVISSMGQVHLTHIWIYLTYSGLNSGISRAGLTPNTRASNGWHADITFEPVPSDYAVRELN